MNGLFQETGFDLSVDSVKVGCHLVVDSEAAACDSIRNLVSLIGFQGCNSVEAAGTVAISCSHSASAGHLLM